jgi:hypothetical protein
MNGVAVAPIVLSSDDLHLKVVDRDGRLAQTRPAAKPRKTTSRQTGTVVREELERRGFAGVCAGSKVFDFADLISKDRDGLANCNGGEGVIL